MASTIAYQEKKILYYWIPSHSGISSNKKADSAAEAGLLRRVTNVLIPFTDFKKHTNVLVKHKWQAEWVETINNRYMQFYFSWICDRKVIELLGVRKMF